jgi:hypothetical protein
VTAVCWCRHPRALRALQVRPSISDISADVPLPT